MADGTTEVSAADPVADQKDKDTTAQEEISPPTPHNNEAARKSVVTQEVYNENLGIEEKPNRLEVIGWYLYEFCSYFVVTALIPIVFPLIISQTVPSHASEPPRIFSCTGKESLLYHGVAERSIHVNSWKLSPLSWVSASWMLGLILAAPLLGYISPHLDYGHNQQIITGAATLIGAIFCLPAGSLKITWIFPPYIAVIVIAHAVATAAHTRSLGLMVRGFAGPTIEKSRFRIRTGVSAWLSLISTASGCVGSGLIAAFAYGMIEHNNVFISLWIVSIFSGIIWLVGAVHIATAQRPGLVTPAIFPKSLHIFSIFSFPQGIGALSGVFIGSFTSMCIFTGGVLYVIDRCIKPAHLLHYWLIYFAFPLVALPVVHPFQQILRGNSVKMQIMGFALSAVVSGVGFYNRSSVWESGIVFIFAALQGVSAGLLHAYGRVVVMDCAPVGKEGAFSAWHSWVRGAGSSIGYAVAAALPGNVGTSFGVAFCAGVAGMVVLVYGNVSDVGGAVAAGHVTERGENRLPEYAFDNGDKSTAEPLPI